MSKTPLTDAKENETINGTLDFELRQSREGWMRHARCGWDHARDLEYELVRALRVVEAVKKCANERWRTYPAPYLEQVLDEWMAGR